MFIPSHLFESLSRARRTTWLGGHKIGTVINELKRDIFYNYRLINHLPPPKIFAIEPTNYCNLRCIMCPHGLKMMTRKKGFMDFNLFKKIVDENEKFMKDYPVDLDNMGEPLLHPQLYDMIKVLKERKINCYFSTNATLLSRKVGEKLIESGLDAIIFSFDGIKKETYERIRVGANFDDVMKNIVNFLKLKEEMKSDNPLVNIQILFINETKNEILDFIKFFSKFDAVDHIVVKQAHAWGGQLTKVYSRLPYYPRDKRKIRYPCKALWDSVVILWDGTVTLCCKDFDAKFPIGNLASRSLKDLWSGDIMTYARRLMIQGRYDKIPPCANCVEWYGYPMDPFYLRGLIQRLIGRRKRIKGKVTFHVYDKKIQKELLRLWKE